MPSADALVTFELTGPARLLAAGNAVLNSIEPCLDAVHHAYQGRGLAILQTTTVAGEIHLKATATGLEPASVILQSQ